MNISTVIKSAPRYLILRYGSLNSYVWENLFPRTEKNKILRRIELESEKKLELKRMKDIVDEATLLVFIFAIRKTFIEGSNAAKSAVDTLKDLGVNEFYLGKAKFSGRNENVMQGEILAKKLFNSLDKNAQSLIEDTVYMHQIIDKYRNSTT